MKIYNGTAHDICIIKNAIYDKNIRKWVGGEVVKKIPKNKPLNVHVDTTYIDEKDGIPICVKSAPFTSDLPYGYDMYIVSMSYAMVHGQTEDERLYVVADTVVDIRSKKVIGCRGLQLYQEHRDGSRY